MKFSKHGVARLTFLAFALAALGLCSGMDAYAAGQPIAKLASFSGDILIKNDGAWGKTPRIGMSLYSDDKIVTKDGNARVQFHDGAIMEVSKYSNCLIRETEKKGFFGGKKTLERSVRLALGKLRMITGKGSGVRTQLATPTAVCGLRGTDVTISIGADGKAYIHFADGTGTNLEDFIMGVADLPEDIAEELSNANEAQRAAYLADAAARQAAAAGAGNEQAQAEAAAVAARELIAFSRGFLANPELRDEMEQIIRSAEKVLQDAEAVLGGESATLQQLKTEIQDIKNDMEPPSGQ